MFLHDVHAARCVQYSSNSVGDGVVRGRGVCVPGGTKSLSTSARCGVWRPAVDELAQTQQASRKMHVETCVGLLQGPDLRIFPGGGNRTGVCRYRGLSFMS